MTFHHRFRVHAPLTHVVDFHTQSASLKAITPPPTIMRVHQAPYQLGEGDEMDFTLWLGPIPVRWIARIEAITPNGFVDRQLRGPFESWIHEHRFESIDENTSEVIDQIEVRLRRHPLWGLLGLGMWLTLPLLFAFRGRKTRQLLERRAR